MIVLKASIYIEVLNRVYELSAGALQGLAEALFNGIIQSKKRLPYMQDSLFVYV